MGKVSPTKIPEIDAFPLQDELLSIALEFLFPEPAVSIKIPFTEISLAVKWGKFLQ